MNRNRGFLYIVLLLPAAAPANVSNEAEAASGNVYMTGTFVEGEVKNRLVEFSRDGTLQNSVEITPPVVNGEGNAVANTIAAFGDDLLIGANHMIFRYTTEGIFQDVFAELPAIFRDNGGIIRIETDSAGNVYATRKSTDICCASALRFDSAGNVTGQFMYTSGNFFTYERGIDADAFGNVYLLTNDPYRISKFSPAGDFLGQVPTTPGFTDLAIDESSNVMYVSKADNSNPTISVFDLSTPLPTFLHSIPVPSDTFGFEGISLDPESGNLLGVSLTERVGMELTTAGVVVETYNFSSSSFFWDIAAVPAIPEPNSIGLLAIGLFCAVRYPTRYRRLHMADMW